jgi:hypothetical protein
LIGGVGIANIMVAGRRLADPVTHHRAHPGPAGVERTDAARRSAMLGAERQGEASGLSGYAQRRS